MSGMERFNFNAKPGEAGFRELTKNKYGHTVLQSVEATDSANDNVNVSIDESGSIRAEKSIWDGPILQELANKFNMPLDSPAPESESSEVESLFQEIELSLANDDNNDNNDDNSDDNNDVVVAGASRFKKVFADNDVKSDGSKIPCINESCPVLLPNNVKFCYSCGKSQKTNRFCVECGRRFADREKFCPDCGCSREQD